MVLKSPLFTDLDAPYLLVHFVIPHLKVGVIFSSK